MEIKGKKTYLAGAAMILSGLAILIKGIHDGVYLQPEALTQILGGFAFIFTRQGIAKVEKSTETK